MHPGALAAGTLLQYNNLHPTCDFYLSLVQFSLPHVRGHNTSRVYEEFGIFPIFTVSWKVGMTHRHPHTKQHIIKLGSERTDNFVPRSDLCLINARTVPVEPLYLINICSETKGRLQA